MEAGLFLWMYLIVIMASILSVLAIRKLPSWTNARVKVMVERIEDNRISMAKGYFVHISERTSFMKWRYNIPLIFFIAVGNLIMLACLLVIQEMQANGQMTETHAIALTLIMTAFALLFTSGFPLGVCLLAFIRSKQVLVVTEQGFEIWERTSKGVQNTKKVLWSDLNKVIHCQYNNAMSRLDYNLRMYSSKGRILVMGDYTNMPRLITDILHKANNANYGLFNDRCILEKLANSDR